MQKINYFYLYFVKSPFKFIYGYLGVNREVHYECQWQASTFKAI